MHFLPMNDVTVCFPNVLLSQWFPASQKFWPSQLVVKASGNCSPRTPGLPKLGKHCTKGTHMFTYIRAGEPTPCPRLHSLRVVCCWRECASSWWGWIKICTGTPHFLVFLTSLDLTSFSHLVIHFAAEERERLLFLEVREFLKLGQEQWIAHPWLKCLTSIWKALPFGTATPSLQAKA